MALLGELVEFIDSELRIAEIPDYPPALNGLQLTNSTGKISRVIAAVDASAAAIQAAAEYGESALLLVHHGLFWQGSQPITGPMFQKLKLAMEADLAIYSAHLPLDIHPQWGNNIQLAKALGIANPKPCINWKGISLGLRGAWHGSREDLLTAVSNAVGGNDVHLAAGGPSEINELAIVTGGAGSEVTQLASLGIHTFITGEGPHWSHPYALEYGINLLLAGHYATETFGVRTLANELAARFDLQSSFIDQPSGL
ncbi:MAG: Nif3-like dinuclear metal center hexameric protein [Luteolibacter sp.]